MPIKPKKPSQPVLPLWPVPVPVPAPFGPMDPPPAIPDRTLELEAERRQYVSRPAPDLVWENLPVHRPSYRMTPDEAERWWAPGVRADQIRWGFR